MAEKNFSITPSVSIPRSKFDRISTHKTAIRLGDIVPIYVDEVLPGDTRALDMSSIIRMSTPIAPIMDDIYFDIFAFFVPARLTWEHWKEFMGENSTGAGIYSGEEYTIPENEICYSEYEGNPYSLAQYFGIALGNNSNFDPDNYVRINELPLRGYHLICNRWFRNQNVEAPVVVDTGDQGNNFYYNDEPRVASKKADYFTKSLPYTQKGDPVVLPIGGVAPIIAGDFHSVGGSVLFGSTNNAGGSLHIKNGALNYDVNDATTAGLVPVSGTNLVADLSNATATTINNLYEAIALQKLLYADATYGSRYWELLYGHFGVKSPDATLQDPEFLGHMKIDVNIEQVLQTTGYTSDADSQLAQIGANSLSGGKGSLFTKSFVEHGYIMIMAVARHRESYGQGINRMWTRKRRFDFYWPEFANLGSQAVLNKELFATGDTQTDEGIFGYQEAWAEYRYKPNIVSSIMNPSMPNSLDFWTLAAKFEAVPTLSTSFTKVNRNSLNRALTTGSEGPDFICDFFFKDTAVRPMPLYSIPGITGVL